MEESEGKFTVKLMVLGFRGFGGHLSSVQNFSLRWGHRNPRGPANTFCSGRNTSLPEKRLAAWRVRAENMERAQQGVC